MKIIETRLEYDNWLRDRLKKGNFKVQRTVLHRLPEWSFDKGRTKFFHKSNNFFKVRGLIFENELIPSERIEQPIVEQPENGVLGFLRKDINNECYLLVQSKFEPGNPNLLQLSPTIQATFSNLTKVHGGNHPKYYDLLEC